MAGLLLRWPGFDPRPIHVAFVMEEVVLDESLTLLRVDVKKCGNI
jgi:hypothetical protein